jgi:hypothetical protein
MPVIFAFILFITSVFSVLSADEQLFIPYSQNKIEGRDCEIAITCVFQNESRWLKEWIEYHRLIGVDHFYLYNHLSSDQYMPVLDPYIKEGIVELFDFKAPTLNFRQHEIYNHTLGLAKDHTKWLAIIDTDEFIVPKATNDLKEYLRIFPETVGALDISWVCFGTSNIWSLMPGELLIEKLYLRAPVSDIVNKWQKMIVRPNAVKSCLNEHYCSYLQGYRKINLTPRSRKGSPLDEAAVQGIRIHHYLFRTKEFFYRIKLRRLKNWNCNDFKVLDINEYLNILNKIPDYSIFKYVPRLKNILFPDRHHANGYNLDNELAYQEPFDASLAHGLIKFFKHEKVQSIADFGCGMGTYVCAFKNNGLICDGFDGNPTTPKLTSNLGSITDLSQPVKLPKQYDWIISLNVGQYIPLPSQRTFIDNISKHCKKGIILSWDQNKQKNEDTNRENYIAVFQDLGFVRDPIAETTLQASASYAHFQNRLIVFRKLKQ